jgi:hypothetical protein
MQKYSNRRAKGVLGYVCARVCVCAGAFQVSRDQSCGGGGETAKSSLSFLHAAPNNYFAPSAEAAYKMRIPCKFMQIKQSAREISLVCGSPQSMFFVA